MFGKPDANKPIIELNTINKLDTAADSLAVAQLNNIKTGLKKIPPPIFNMPAAKPNTAPKNNALSKGMGLIACLLLPETIPDKRNIGNMKAKPSSKLCVLSCNTSLEHGLKNSGAP